jgi:electron transfer flavoprotein alpha subunit
MGKVLIFSENDNIAFELLTAGRMLASSDAAAVAAVVLGAGAENRVNEYLNRGVTKAITAGRGKELLDVFDAQTYATALVQIAEQEQATLILIGCTRRGKELAGRVAQKLGAGCINDVNAIECDGGEFVYSRNALGGATVRRLAVASPVAVISIMPAAFPQVAEAPSAGEKVVVDLELKPSRVKLVECQAKNTDSVDIAEAKTLVCVGMGLGGPEKLPMVEELAKVLGGEVACTKPVATDQKWLPEARMVGLSGKKCKPQLSLCLGLSGQVQFAVGIRDSKTIVAINTDENATIFQYADYGIVGDLNIIAEKLTAQLK